MAIVKASAVTYELHTLGWKAFQDLCLTIVGETLGQAVQAFHPSRDGGRDGAFYGKWQAQDGTGYTGPFTVQCKFTSIPNAYLQKSHLADELEKSARLASGGLATNYILMTNYGISGRTEESIRDAFLSVDGIETFTLLGAEWLAMRIRESARLRMLVPRVYGLGDLSQILDERRYAQAEAILNAMGDSIERMVITEAYRRSARALRDHGFVLLLGSPASGKSTIAASLAVAAIDALGCSTMSIRNADEFVQHWNPHEPKQFFWVDDAFGATQYQREAALEWSRAFPYLHTAVRRGARVLFTSRDYIYQAAREELKITAFPLVDESQVVISVQDLSLEEKSQILYNHMKLGNQPQAFKSSVKQHLPAAAASNAFLPEAARRLGHQLFTRSLRTDRRSILEFFEKPLTFLVEVLRGLDSNSRASLALIFMNGGSLSSPFSFSDAEAEALRILGATPSRVRSALRALDHSLVRYIPGSRPKWIFQHPTISDALAEIISQDPELLDIYISGTPTNKLVQEVVCGDIRIPGAKLVVPLSRYQLIAERLKVMSHYSQKCSFLARRCDRAFLKAYVVEDPAFLSRIACVGSYLSASSDALLVARLHREGLLPNDVRAEFVEQVKELAVTTPDADFLSNSEIRSVFTSEELDELLWDVHHRLIPKLSEIVAEWHSNYPEGEDPNDYFQPLLDALATFKRELRFQLGIAPLIDDATKEITARAKELASSMSDSDYAQGDFPQSVSVMVDASEERSIFEDVDL